MTVSGLRLSSKDPASHATQAPANRQVELLASILVRQGQCDAQTIDRGRRVAAESGQRLDQVLLQLGLVTERGLAEGYATLLGAPLAGRDDYTVQMFPRDASRVWGTVEVNVNAVTGQAIGVFDPGRQPAGNTLPLWVIFLHNGQMFGLAGRAVVLAEGLTLCALALTGPWLWWARRRAGRLTSGILGVTPD